MFAILDNNTKNLRAFFAGSVKAVVERIFQVFVAVQYFLFVQEFFKNKSGFRVGGIKNKVYLGGIKYNYTENTMRGRINSSKIGV